MESTVFMDARSKLFLHAGRGAEVLEMPVLIKLVKLTSIKIRMSILGPLVIKGALMVSISVRR